MDAPPRVFLSHATEDKERFVRPFAIDLRRRGLDVWVDEWELLPGDSLVDKIFEDGLGKAQAVIIVLSRVSVQKRWVREELNAGVVNRINRGHRLIPVVLDDVEVPESLKSTVWVRVEDVSDFANQAARVVAAVFGQHLKPPVGPAPEYVRESELAIEGLSGIDTVILRLFGENAVDRRCTRTISTEERWAEAEKLGVGREDYLDSLEILARRGYLEETPFFDFKQPWPTKVVTYYHITELGLDIYLHNSYPKFLEIYRQVASEILNKPDKTNLQLAQTVRQPVFIVDQVLRAFEAKSLLRLFRDRTGEIRVGRVSAEFRRMVGKYDGA